LFTNAVFTSSRSPLGSQKKSTKGTSTLGLGSPSQYIRSSTERSSNWIGWPKWLWGRAK
jgi:hypothetical protein